MTAVVWRICLPTTNEELLFTGLSERNDPGDERVCYEEEFIYKLFLKFQYFKEDVTTKILLLPNEPNDERIATQQRCHEKLKLVSSVSVSFLYLIMPFCE